MALNSDGYSTRMISLASSLKPKPRLSLNAMLGCFWFIFRFLIPAKLLSQFSFLMAIPGIKRSSCSSGVVMRVFVSGSRSSVCPYV